MKPRSRCRFYSVMFGIALSLAALTACNSTAQLPSQVPISLADQGAPKGTTAARERFETLKETSVIVDMRTVNDKDYPYLNGAIVNVQHWDSSDELTTVTITTARNGDYKYNKNVSFAVTYQGSLLSWCFGQDKPDSKCGGVKMGVILQQLNADFGRVLTAP